MKRIVGKERIVGRYVRIVGLKVIVIQILHACAFSKLLNLLQLNFPLIFVSYWSHQ